MGWQKRRITVEDMTMKQLAECVQAMLTHMQLEAIGEESYRDGEIIELVPIGTNIDADEDY